MVDSGLMIEKALVLLERIGMCASLITANATWMS
jgi:hypothetical protein